LLHQLWLFDTIFVLLESANEEISGYLFFVVTLIFYVTCSVMNVLDEHFHFQSLHFWSSTSLDTFHTRLRIQNIIHMNVLCDVECVYRSCHLPCVLNARWSFKNTEKNVYARHGVPEKFLFCPTRCDRDGYHTWCIAHEYCSVFHVKDDYLRWRNTSAKSMHTFWFEFYKTPKSENWSRSGQVHGDARTMSFVNIFTIFITLENNLEKGIVIYLFTIYVFWPRKSVGEDVS